MFRKFTKKKAPVANLILVKLQAFTEAAKGSFLKKGVLTKVFAKFSGKHLC